MTFPNLTNNPQTQSLNLRPPFDNEFPIFSALDAIVYGNVCDLSFSMSLHVKFDVPIAAAWAQACLLMHTKLPSEKGQPEHKRHFQ